MLRGVITELRHLHHRPLAPSGNAVRADHPLDRAARRTGRRGRSHDEPAVVVLVAPVVEPQIAGAGLDHEAVRLRFAGDGESPPARERYGLELAPRVLLHRSVRLAREDSRRAAEVPALAEQVGGIQLEVEAEPARPLLRQWLLQVDVEVNRVALGAHAHLIAEREIGIDDRVEAVSVLARVRVRERGHDLASRAAHFAAILLRHRRPLARRRLETYVAIRGDAHAVLHDRHAALMTVRIEILERHHVHAVAMEVVARGEHEGTLCGQHAAECEEERGGEDDRTEHGPVGR